eukprot:NODE_2212_length_501_cov_41.703704_g2196_i0.p1 GENE.NODE_2212_length_501_cov_41.703704_g2196_i0~~NODE_2212_length_501_cov_41.703704_g2196_i0.p1  ORF type:complete len:138 (+),score=27.23 NODE_2212_length_501_cov_41.703704_g2196_i0:48-416(+)
MNMAGGPRGNDALANKVACFLLKAAYQGTLYAAAINAHTHTDFPWERRRKVHLTLIGGGVFGNRSEWIVDAMTSPECEKIIDEAGLDVYVTLFDARSGVPEKLAEFCNKKGGQRIKLTAKDS